MKTFIVLSFFVAVISAHILREKQPRITNGEIAIPGQFPYQAGLLVAFGKYSFWCGGTIISNRWILTAAHCTLNADGAIVYMGAFDIDNDTEQGQQRVYISKRNIYVHDNYSFTEVDHDIALIKLPIIIEFNKFIQPAALPKKNGNYSTYENELAVASGWGKESDKAETVTQFLRYVEVPVAKQTKCKIYYYNITNITADMICIETKYQKSTCSGDSGGPLIHVDDTNVKTLIGVTSFGVSVGCEKGWPVVFTRITSYLDWIEKISGVVNK